MTNTPTVINVVQRKLVLADDVSDGEEVRVIINMHADLCRWFMV